ncbi:NAD-dependent epimerase/dehydratase family protein [Betaproteobacteria bacterium]|nr:NAD-dependent epimerase/dehydratase family protein [Betaproteobacteria bacterium]
MGISRKTKIYLAGHRGFLGTAIYDCLKENDFENVITFTRKELDLSNTIDTLHKLSESEPEIILNAAGMTGGVIFNQKNPASLALQNLLLQNSIFFSATKIPSISRVIYFGSSCMYPRSQNTPMNEELLFRGQLEPTSFAYAMAKLSGVSVGEAINKELNNCSVTSIIPSGVYGPGDNFDLKSSHVVAALIKKFSIAKDENIPEVTLFGDGSPVRQFLFIKDLAKFIVYCLDNFQSSKGIFNVGNEKGVSIAELAQLIKNEVNYKGEVLWDTSKPNGAPYKVLDTGKCLNLGWSPSTSFPEGLRETVSFFSSLK